MLTLREFLEEVNAHEHYRIYLPNRDCLLFESYFKVHSPYYFDGKEEHLLKLKDEYWENNDFCDDVRHCKEFDKETKELLDRYGNYKVHSLECSGFRPKKVYKGDNDKIKVDYLEGDPLRPNSEYIDCFNVFIL